jgi:hypothetical protein
MDRFSIAICLGKGKLNEPCVYDRVGERPRKMDRGSRETDLQTAQEDLLDDFCRQGFQT